MTASHQLSDIGLTGLAVMGENLALNLAGRGYRVTVHNRTTEKTEHFMQTRAGGLPFAAAHSLREFVASLSRPRRIIMMVKAGQAVDDLIDGFAPYLEPGDILIDCGNSHYQDTNRRVDRVEGLGFLYVGSGVSGGEEGALKGPSIMPGGSKPAWEAVGPVLEAIAARADDGDPCCRWIGPQGAGHFVKMVHNGIEYAYMQMIADAYQVLRDLLRLSPIKIREVFDGWNRGALQGYLIEITAAVLGRFDDAGRPLVDAILDASSQKGTGRWTVESALALGVPLTAISDAVFGRALSAGKDLRVAAAGLLAGPDVAPPGDPAGLLADLEQALWAAQAVAYAQGFTLMREAAAEYRWPLEPGEIAAIWRGGCIIRSAVLGRMTEGFRRNPELPNLLFDPYFRDHINRAQAGLRRVVAAAAVGGVPVSGLATALGYYDALRTARLPHDLIQAQRDYFGAHMYERVDRPRGEMYHRDWIGTGDESRMK